MLRRVVLQLDYIEPLSGGFKHGGCPPCLLRSYRGETVNSSGRTSTCWMDDAFHGAPKQRQLRCAAYRTQVVVWRSSTRSSIRLIFFLSASYNFALPFLGVDLNATSRLVPHGIFLLSSLIHFDCHLCQARHTSQDLQRP